MKEKGLASKEQFVLYLVSMRYISTIIVNIEHAFLVRIPTPISLVACCFSYYSMTCFSTYLHFSVMYDK